MSDVRPPYELTANLHVVTDDSGQYGTTYCGNCEQELSSSSRVREIPRACPNCNRRLVGVKDTTPRGGSDF